MKQKATLDSFLERGAISQSQDEPYTLSIGVGYDRLGTTDDTVQNCIRRADKKLYSDKKQRKSR